MIACSNVHRSLILHGVLLLGLSLNLNAQVMYKKDLGRDLTSQSFHYVESADVFSDGSHILLCRVDSTQSRSQLVKLDVNGVIQWAFGLTHLNGVRPVSVHITSDGGFIACISVSNYNVYGPAEIGLMKFDNTGNLQWQTLFLRTNVQQACDMIITADGGYAIAGYETDSMAGDTSVIILKCNPAGALLWSKKYTVNGKHVPEAITESSGGELFVCGEQSNAGLSPFVLKTNPSGSFLWMRDFSGLTTSMFTGMAAYSSDLIAVGYDYGSSLALRSVVCRISSNGNLVWTRQFGSQASGVLTWAIQKTIDNKYVITGRQWDSSIFGFCPFIKKFDQNALESWHVFHGFGQGNRLSGTCITSDPDGGYFVGGTEIAHVFKTDANGSAGCLDTNMVLPLNPLTLQANVINPVTSNIAFTTGNQVYIITPIIMEYWYCTSSTTTTTISTATTFSIFPNPATSHQNIQITFSEIVDKGILTISDISGRVLQVFKNISGGSFEFSAGDLSTGLYFITLKNGQSSHSSLLAISDGN